MSDPLTIEFVVGGEQVLRQGRWPLGVPRRGDRVRLDGVKRALRVADVTWKIGRHGTRVVVVDLRDEGPHDRA